LRAKRFGSLPPANEDPQTVRVKYVVGNWKMNCTLGPARELVAELAAQLRGLADVEVGIAPPAVLLMPMCKAVQGTPIQLGAQNVYCERSGAFTGEISPPMLVDAGCRFVIIGHSERRQLFGENGDLLARKVQAALAEGLRVIYCIGETLEQREAGATTDVLERQLQEALAPDLTWSELTVAYEPVWAIGTGRSASPEQAEEAHAFVRGWLAGQYGSDAAGHIRIQYGGSVKAAAAPELMAMPDVDGALVGGASLKASEFAAIVSAAAEVGAGRP
jgi:triosephosphate isomerase